MIIFRRYKLFFTALLLQLSLGGVAWSQSVVDNDSPNASQIGAWT